MDSSIAMFKEKWRAKELSRLSGLNCVFLKSGWEKDSWEGYFPGEDGEIDE